MPGLPASFEREGKKYDMEVTKVYPEVREGQFRTDLHFVSGRPENIRAAPTQTERPNTFRAERDFRARWLLIT